MQEWQPQVGLGPRRPMIVPDRMSERCSLDLSRRPKHIRLFRVLAVIDAFTRECLPLVAVRPAWPGNGTPSSPVAVSLAKPAPPNAHWNAGRVAELPTAPCLSTPPGIKWSPTRGYRTACQRREISSISRWLHGGYERSA